MSETSPRLRVLNILSKVQHTVMQYTVLTLKSTKIPSFMYGKFNYKTYLNAQSNNSALKLFIQKKK